MKTKSKSVKVGAIILMALTKMGMWMTDARGKSNGHVITKNRQGQAVRTKVTPVNRRSNAQQAQRNRLTGFSQAWRGLTQDQRDAWNSAAQEVKKSNIFGDSYSPTGFNYFQIVNQNLALVGTAQTDDPISPEPPVNPTSFGIASNTNAAQTLSFAASPIGADTTFIIEATRPLSAGVSSPGSAFRKVTTATTAATSPLNTFTAYEAVFGTPITGKKIFFRVTPVNDVTGVRGIPLQVSGVTA